MKKVLFLISTYSFFLMTVLCADGLKNSLNNILHQKEETAVVDLGEINFNPKPVSKKRTGHTVIATVNRKKILKKDADAYLKKRTQGKITNFDLLPANQKKRLVEEMAVPFLITKAAISELSEEEKNSVYVSMWMRKEASKIDITDQQILETYNAMKKASIKEQSMTDIPKFEEIRDRLKAQMIERKIMSNLLKNAKFKIMP